MEHPGISLVVGGLIVFGLAMILAAPAAAHFDSSSRYTHSACPPTAENRVDPINVVFASWGTWGRAVNQIEAHAGWGDTSGFGQTFVDHGACSPLHAQRASRSGTRFHVRVRGQHPDDVLGWTATGDAHHEDLVLFPVPCGHAVDADGSEGSGFDQGRNELERGFAAAGHATWRAWWGNTSSFKQCDGDYASSDGWTVFIELHQTNH